MGIKYENLNDDTRRYMRMESDLGGHYNSPRLNDQGAANWVNLLCEAIANHTDDWLGTELVRRDFFRNRETYMRQGKAYSRDINIPHAALQLAEGEFNRYYLRALCRIAQEKGITHLVVYRGKAVENARPESEAMIGKLVAVDELLLALRSNDFVTIGDVLKVPGGPNSGLTARFP